MKRKDFLKCCTSGLCACTAFGLLPREEATAQSGGAVKDAEKEELKWKVNAAQERFAKLLRILDQHLDKTAKQRVLESLGGECAQSYRELVAKHKGDIRGFLAYAEKNWVEKAEYDEKAGTIRIIDKQKTCSCPLVKQGVTSGDFCSCTLGWQKTTYSAILGKPVVAEIEESILRGGTRCIYRIRIV